jgi:parallel beta-helix repeat protein
MRKASREHSELRFLLRPMMLGYLLVLVGVLSGCGLVGGNQVPSGHQKETVGTKTIHVAMDGNDNSRGTNSHPMRTIKAAIAKSRARGKIVVHAGTYHESLTINRRPGLTITAAPDEAVWLDGATLVDKWTRRGSVWVAFDWSVEFDSSPTFTWDEPDNRKVGWKFVDPSYPVAAHPDQVWIDGHRQVQVESRSEVVNGTFYVDYDRNRLYLGSDPTGRIVEASSLAKAINIRSANAVIRGIGVRNYAPSVPHMGAVVVDAPDVTLDKVSIVGSATTGLHIKDRGATLHNVTSNDNGMMGISGTGADRLHLDHIVARGNNVERFNSAPSAGGVKIGRTIGITVENSAFENNLGNGLWFDESVYDMGVFNSRIVDNTGHGLSVEISGKADIVGNIIARNGRNGIKINDSDSIRLWNNTLSQNDRAINIVQDDRDLDAQGSYRDWTLPLTWQNRDIEVSNNIMSSSSGDCLLCVEDYSGRWRASQLNVTALGNVYHRSDNRSLRWVVVWARGPKPPDVFETLTEFWEATGQERQSRLLTGESVLTDDLQPKPMIGHLVGAVARPLPVALATKCRVSAGTQHLGAWRS